MKLRGLTQGLLASLALCAIAIPTFAASDGIDSTSSLMHIAVMGQTALTLTKDTSGTVPPQPTLSFSGPLVEDGTVISTDGTLTMTALANLNGGITVNQGWNPAQALSINSNQIWKSVTTGDATLYLQYSTNGGAVMIGGASGSTNNLQIANGNVLLSSGSVGINTNSPAAALDVNGQIYLEPNNNVTEGNACSPSGLVGRDSTGALFDCQYNSTLGNTTWGRPQTFSRISTTISAVNAACVAGGDPNPPSYNPLEYNTTCASRYCEATLGYGFGILIEAPPPGYNGVQPFTLSSPSEPVIIACSR